MTADDPHRATRLGARPLPLCYGEILETGRRSAWPMVMAGAVVLVVVATLVILTGLN